MSLLEIPGKVGEFDEDWREANLLKAMKIMHM